MNQYGYPGYYYPMFQPPTNTYPSTFNGYQSLDPQSNTMNQHLNVMNYYNQMQACYSLNNALSQIDATPTDSSQQPGQSLNAYAPQNPK
jgi:hypothetical protein